MDERHASQFYSANDRFCSANGKVLCWYGIVKNEAMRNGPVNKTHLLDDNLFAADDVYAFAETANIGANPPAVNRVDVGIR